MKWCRWPAVLFFLVFIVTISCWAINIIVIGSWTQDIDTTHLQGPAGSDLTAVFESAANQISISIEDTNRQFQVDVRRLDSNWNPDLHLYIRRISDAAWGHPRRWVSGGTTYQEIMVASQYFFNGYRYNGGIDVQLKLEGVSIQVPPGIYQTSVIYTVIEQ